MLGIRFVYVALFAAIAFLSAGPAAASGRRRTHAGRFPPTGDIDGMSITYEITGAELDGPRMPKEAELFGYNLPGSHKILQDQITSGRARWYSGRVTGSRLTVSGTARASSRWAILSVSVQGEKPSNYVPQRVEKEVGEGQTYVQAFSVSIELAPDETYARFDILFESELGEDTVWLRVAGDFLIAPPGPPRLTAESEERWLPPDGVSKSRVTFTYLEGERPVSGKTIKVSLAPRRGTLDASSATTDDNGQAVVNFTAPKPEEGHVASVNVTGEAEKPTLIAEVNIQLTPLGIVDLGINSRADAGWDSIALEAKVQNFHTARLRDIRVVFYAGEGSASGQRLGEQTIPDLMPGEAAWSGGPEADTKFVDWVLFGNAEKARLTVMVLDAKDDAGELELPPPGVAALRTFTVSNYAAPFVTNVDGYNFVNLGNEVGGPLWLEDQLAAMLAADQQAGSGLTILSYSALLQDVAAWTPKDSQGQPVWPGLGHCQGVSATAINYFLYPSDRPAPGPTYLYSFDDPKVRSNIVLQQMYQNSSYYQSKEPWRGSIDPIPARLIDLQKTLKDELSAAHPVMLWVKEPGGGAGGRDASHAVVAYQMVEVPELDLARLVINDPNFPHSELMDADGLAKAGSLNVSKQAFSYEAGYHYKEVALMWTPRLPPTSAQAFYDLTRELADSTLRELVGATPQQRLVVYRGSNEPLFVTKDGKQRIGWETDKSGKKKLINQMPGATVWRFGSYDVYIFKLPPNIQVTSSTRVSSTGTITVGVVSPTPAGTSLDIRGPGTGQLGIPAMAGPEAKAVLFRKAAVQSGATVELDLNATGDAALRVSGQAVAPTGQETLTADQFAPPQGAMAAAPAGAASANWMDPLDGEANSGPSSLSISSGNVASSRVVSWDPGSDGKAAALTTFDSYIGYGGSRLPADKGSILFRWQPAPNLAQVFGRPNYDLGWTDYGDEEPPQWGFLLDTVGWGDAPPGALALILDPTPYGSLNFGVWEGSEGRFATWDVPSNWEWDPERWYEIGVTWGPRGMSLLLDGEVKATVPDVVRVNNRIPWFMGQAPSYWPYGPHTMMGFYDELRVYGEQLVALRRRPWPVAPGSPW